MGSFFGPFETFASLVNRRVVLHTQKSTYFAVDTFYLASLMKARVSAVAVDEAWYVGRYPDIEPAIAEGRIATPAEHYALFGYYEHRMPYPILVDEAWYLDRNSDVREAVDNGVFASAQAHFDEVGFREGRPPYPDFSLRLRVERGVLEDA